MKTPRSVWVVFGCACMVTIGVAHADDRDKKRERRLTERGGNDASAAAVFLGLEWLAKQQRDDGSWERAGKPSCAATGLAIHPFLNIDITHQNAFEGSDQNASHPYRKVVARGLKYLVDNQQPDGSFKDSDLRGHCWCARALAEACRRSNSMTFKDDGTFRTEETFKKQAQLAIAFLVKQAKKDGGFGDSKSNTIDTGYAFLALHSGLMAGLDVPRETRDGSMTYLDSVASKDGDEYALSAGEKPSPEASAMALLCRLHSGWGIRTPGLIWGVQKLPKAFTPKSADDIPVAFLVNQTIYNVDTGGHTDRETWLAKCRDLFVESQDKGIKGETNKGSWCCERIKIDRLEATCLAILSLEVYYHWPRLSGKPRMIWFDGIGPLPQ